MKMRRFKQLLAVSFAIAALCTNIAFAAETPTDNSSATNEVAATQGNTEKDKDIISEKELIVDKTDQSTAGEQTLPTKEQLADVKGEKIGSIVIQLTDGKAGSSKNGIRFSCVKVADVVAGEYVLDTRYQQSGVDLNAVDSAAVLKTAAEKLSGYQIGEEKTATTDQKGAVSFSNLEVGVYLIQGEDNPTFDVIEPALIAIPTWSDAEKEMLYEVTMEPKHTPRPDQPNHTAPQTGLQDRTLYYLAGAGGCIAVAGVLLLLGRKRKR